MFSIYFSFSSILIQRVHLDIPKLSQNLGVGQDFEVLLCKLVLKKLQGKQFHVW